MVCPFPCVVITPSGLVGGVGVLSFSVNGNSFLRARKRDFPYLENPSLLVAILFYCAGAAAAACAFFLALYSRAFMRSYSRCFSRFRARYSLEYCR